MFLLDEEYPPPRALGAAHCLFLSFCVSRRFSGSGESIPFNGRRSVCRKAARARSYGGMASCFYASRDSTSLCCFGGGAARYAGEYTQYGPAAIGSGRVCRSGRLPRRSVTGQRKGSGTRLWGFPGRGRDIGSGRSKQTLRRIWGWTSPKVLWRGSLSLPLAG